MQIEGKIIAVLPLREGDGRQGKWQSQEYVIETHDKFPHKICFGVFSEDRIKRFAIRQGQEVSVSFDIDAHEYNGRWYNSINAFDVRLREPVQAPTPNVVYAKQVANEQPSDDLPF